MDEPPVFRARGRHDPRRLQRRAGPAARHQSRAARARWPASRPRSSEKTGIKQPARRLQPRVRLLYRSLKGPDRPRCRRPTSASRRSPTGERYITPELKELERTILTAKDRITALEYELFSQVRQHLADQSARIQRTARAVAALDVLTNFAGAGRPAELLPPGDRPLRRAAYHRRPPSRSGAGAQG